LTKIREIILTAEGDGLHYIISYLAVDKNQRDHPDPDRRHISSVSAK